MTLQEQAEAETTREDEVHRLIEQEIARRAHPHAESRELAWERAVSYVGRRWLGFVSGALWVFVGLAWLAPVFAGIGWWGLADPIYTAYAFT